MSDKGSRGERVDTSGPAIRDAAMEAMEIGLARGMIIPDEPEMLKAALVDCCLFQGSIWSSPPEERAWGRAISRPK